MNKKTALIAQVIMTCIMAATMSGLMSLIALGPTQAWLAAWPRQFAVAWPIAFALTMLAWPVATASPSGSFGRPPPTGRTRAHRISRTSCGQRQARAKRAAQRSASSLDSTSTTVNPPSNSRVCG
ncbi:hypothetical protein BW730_10725 [Tessaracoccus aquimaris]|uniref:DUF2798 domain-containing protein n=1 Tax=Tessaracoccus aquimaris TaxID=1332264 RepID=A0A1Q2CP61_9ACTN|nr:hypothetical protein BW730_10725 [Tessaracoccus aquimaris]